VGERGPELFVSKTAGTIIPNNRLGRAGRGDNINNVTTTINILKDGQSETKVSGHGGAQPWADMAKSIEGIVKQTIQKEQRLGNSLNPVFRRGGGGL
jgi:hypothetical protein